MAGDGNNISGDVGTTAGARAGGRYRYSSTKPESGASLGQGGAVVIEGGEEAMLEALPSYPVDWGRIAIGLGAALFCFLALYPAELLGLEARWYTDAGWSHGFVVPLISLFLIRVKWDTLRRLKPAGSLVGFAVLLLGVAGQVLFRATGTVHMSNLSILVVLFGGVLFVFGWEHLKILWLPIGFLLFAIPPPNDLYQKMTVPMQLIAAQVGVWFLPIFGCAAQRTGTVIEVMKSSGGIARLNVEEACSGMRMLVAFLALAVALAYSTSRPMWQKVFLACCAVPIAIFCNALRVTFTGVLVAKVGQEWGEGNAHAYFGLLMLIPAMGMQLGVAWILDHIFIEEPETAEAVVQ